MAIVLTDLPLSPIVLLVVILTIYVVVYATYNLFLHPLARVPGPFLAHLTSTWLQFYDLAGVRVYMIDDLHQRFGPVVRVAPNELSFADPSMIKEIYGQASPYMKSAMYSLLSVGPHLGVFDTADREVHKKRRRLISHVFAATSVNACEPVIADLIRHLLRWIKKESESIPPRPVDVFVWFRMLTLDVAGALFFGTSFNALASGKIHPYLEDIDNHFVIAGIRWQLPYFLPLTSWLPISSWQYFLKTRQRLYDYGRATFDEYISRYGRSPASNRIDLLKKIINSSDEKGVVSLTDEEIISEVGIFMLGGTDTTSIVLTYTLWELARQPLWQNKLREELKEHVIFNDGVPSWQQVQNLKILDAVITEGLRLHPAVPGGLPRVAPKEGVRMSGFWVPGGVSQLMDDHLTSEAHIYRLLFPCPLGPSIITLPSITRPRPSSLVAGSNLIVRSISSQCVTRSLHGRAGAVFV